MTCSFFWNCASEFQTLISGTLAIVAAMATAFVLVHTSRMSIIAEKEKQDKVDRQKSNFAANQMIIELKRIRARVKQVESTIKVVVAANTMISDETREQCYLDVGSILSNWEFVSLFHENEQKDFLEFKDTIEEFNRCIKRSGGAFGATNWQEYLFRQLEQITIKTQKISQHLGINLPNIR